MSDMLRDFESACERAGVTPTAALKAGGVHPTLWGKWKGGKSPTLKNFERAKRGLELVAKAKAA